MVNSIAKIHMGTDGCQTYHGDYFITYANVKSLRSTAETNITFYFKSTICEYKKKT